MDVWSWLTNQAILLSYGYIGIFILSFLGSLIVFVPMPYFIPIVLASFIFDPNIIALSSAIGATLAKTIIFRAACLGRKFLDEGTQRRLRPFERLVSRYGWLAAFLAAVTPIPDDLVYIPLGFTRYSLWRFMTATFIGKLIFTLLIAWGARFSFAYVELIIGGITDPLIAIVAAVILAVVVVVIVYLMLRLEWSKILGRWFPWTIEKVDRGDP